MKSFHIALVLTLLLTVGGNLPAEARPGGYSGTSSYKSGFSSQKRYVYRPAPAVPPPPARNSGPGAFGAPAASAPPAARGNSALSRDLEQSGAQVNALKTLDARRAAGAPPPPVSPQDAAAQRPPTPAPGGVYPMPGPDYRPPMPQPIIVQQQNSGLMYGLMGFMLGRSMSHPQPAYYPGNNGGNNNPGVPGAAGADAGTSAGGAGDAAAAPVAPHSSLFGTVLRILAWLALLSAMWWLLRAGLRRLRRAKVGAVNYSFERK